MSGEVLAEPSSSAIRNAIIEKLDATKGFGPHEISIQAKYGKVTLDGEVASEHDKSLLEQYAREVDGVQEVRSFLHVNPGAGTKRRGDLAKAVRSAIEESVHRAPFAYQVTIHTFDGEVRLKGRAPGKEEVERLIAIARGVEGVTKVTSEIEILKSVSDAEILERVKQAMDRSTACTGASHLEVAVKQGVVTLTGAAPYHRDADCALSVILNVEGVKDVRSEAKIGGE